MNISEAFGKGNQLYDGSKGVALGPFVRQGDLTERLLTSKEGAEIVFALHLLHVYCGVDGIQTAGSNTNNRTLSLHGFQESDSERLAYNSAVIARAAADTAGNGVWVVGSIMPSGMGVYNEGGDYQPDEIAQVHRQQIRSLVEGGVDAITLETFYSLAEMGAVLEAVEQEAKGVPVILTMTFSPIPNTVGALKFHRTAHGVSPAKLVEFAGKHPAVIGCGANCGVGIKTAEQLMREFLAATQSREKPLSLVAKLNAGMPPDYASPDEMADYAREMHQLGIPVIGGCCGTGVNHVWAMGKALGKEQRGWIEPTNEILNRLKTDRPPQLTNMLKQLKL